MDKPYYEQRQQHPSGQIWMVNYDACRALANYFFLAAHEDAIARPRVFASTSCAAIVVTNGPLEAIRDPHVAAWRESFFELTRDEFLQRASDCMTGRLRFLGETGAERAA